MIGSLVQKRVSGRAYFKSAAVAGPFVRMLGERGYYAERLRVSGGGWFVRWGSTQAESFTRQQRIR